MVSSTKFPSFQTGKSACCVAVTHSLIIASQRPQKHSNHMQQSFLTLLDKLLISYMIYYAEIPEESD